MAYSPEIIDQVRQASDIVQVVQQWVPLKKAGANWKGLCPFHNEKSPSFNVHPAKQIYHCFGCGEGGDVFAFVQKMQKSGFGEALQWLAERAGVALPDESGDEAGRQAAAARKRQDEAQVRLLELAAAWFRRNLEEGAEGAAARDYATHRGLDPATRESFQLGYAPNDGRVLAAAAMKKGFSEQDLLDAGLVIKNERGLYARFRGRLMFPIHDPKGRLVGFGGRIMGDGEPKYLNSPETTLFSKGRLLYPWPQAREALGKRREALVCEGYMDAIACHQAGLTQAVASLGTALTDEHAKLLKRYVDRVLLVFDADAAGLRAARRAGEPLLGAGLDVRVARLKGAKDPDELLRREGPDALRQALDLAQPLVGFCVEASLAGYGPAPSPSQRAAALADIFPLLVRLASSAEADAALQSAARTVSVSEEAARADLAAFRKGEARPQRAVAATPAVTEAPDPRHARVSEPLLLAERELLALLVAHSDLVERAKGELGHPSFHAPDLQAAVDLLWLAPGGVVMALGDDGSEAYKLGDALLSELSQRRLPQLAPPEESLADLILRRQVLMLERELATLKMAVRQTTDPVALRELMQKIQEHNQVIEGLRRERRDRTMIKPEENA